MKPLQRVRIPQKISPEWVHYALELLGFDLNKTVVCYYRFEQRSTTIYWRMK